MSDKHAVTVIAGEKPNRVRRACSCGWTSIDVPPRVVDDPPQPCPRDPTVVALMTLQFHWGGLIDSVPADGAMVHLLRATAMGTPGPTLCGIDRFAKDSPGWSTGGGISGPGIVHTPCAGCAQVARTDFAGLPIAGSVGAKEMRAELATEAAEVSA